MALALTVDKIDSVPEALRGEYTEKDGKFHLNVDGLDAAYVPRTALQTANNEAATRRHQLAAWEKIGKTPDEIAALVAAADTDATEKAKKKGDFDGILKQHSDKWAAREAELTKSESEAKAAARAAIVDASVLGTLANYKTTQEGVDLLTERLGRRVQLEFVNGKPAHKIMQADGVTPMAGSGSDGLATYDDLVKEAVKTWPSLFEGTGAGGSGAPSKSGGGPAGKTITRADWEKLPDAERIAKRKDGVKVVD